jgi:hypothetical protein
MTDNQLIAVRILIEKAKSQISKVGTEKAFAALHAHDALDWAMQYLHHSVERKKSELSFKNFSKYISENTDKFGYFDKTKAQELDEMRNSFKHSFVLPNDRRLRELVVWSEQQINSMLRTYTGKTLGEYDILESITLPEVKDELRLARKLMADHNKGEALAHVAIAFDRVTRLVEESIEKASGEIPAISADFTFSSSFFMHIKSLGELIGKGNELERNWDNIIQSIVHLNAASLANILGLDIHDYYRFRSSTPKPQRSLNNSYHVDLMPNLIERLPSIDYDFCESFVIQAVVNASSIITSNTTIDQRDARDIISN